MHLLEQLFILYSLLKNPTKAVIIVYFNIFAKIFNLLYFAIYSARISFITTVYIQNRLCYYISIKWNNTINK